MGSLMGQVRHKGVLIPWDTDIDLYVDGDSEDRLLKVPLPPQCTQSPHQMKPFHHVSILWAIPMAMILGRVDRCNGVFGPIFGIAEDMPSSMDHTSASPSCHPSAPGRGVTDWFFFFKSD
jgi:hypothetical protein